MRYTFESSDTEMTALYNLLAVGIREIGKTVRHSNELRRSRAVTVQTVQSEIVSDSAGEDEASNVLNFVRPVETSAHSSEEEDSTFYETQPFSEPVAAPEAEPAPVDPRIERGQRKGRAAFYEFIRDWLVGIDFDTMALIDGIKQPDRAQLLRDLQNSSNAFNVLLFVKKCGGLQCAIAEVTGSEALALALSPFIVPPASIAFSDLADTFEYNNPFKKDED